MTLRHVVLIANSAFTMLNFRSGLIRCLRSHGHRVSCICRGEARADAHFAELGARHVDWRLEAATARPLGEARSLLQLASHLDHLDPDVALTFTIKPNLYTGLLARTRRFRFVPTVTGLGTAFLERDRTLGVVRQLLRVSLSRADHVFVQNGADARVLLTQLHVPAQRLSVVPGSGVALADFEDVHPLPFSRTTDRVFSFVGRFLRQKGIAEFAAAAQLLREAGAPARCVVHGDDQAANRSVVSCRELRDLSGGHLTFHAWCDDPRTAYASCHFLVLPSYREGMSRTLIEAAACGVPAVTTAVPGCQDVVVDGVNGFLCEAGDARALQRAMERAIGLEPAQYERMSRAARLAAREFRSERVDPSYVRQV